MNIDVTDLKNSIDAVRANPAAIQRIVLDKLMGAMDGSFNVVDPSNPFVFLLESAAVMSSVAMIQNETNNRKQYPSVAQTEDELYLHMADVDYIGRFATPSRTSFTILLGKDEIYSRAIATGIGNTRKLVIPRNTEFTISGYKFTMQYPIEIRIMVHGGLQIVYDVDKPSPLETLESNNVNWNIVKIDNTDWVALQVPVSQFKIESFYSGLSASAGFKERYDITDSYYYCRVFLSTPDKKWKEILTTHSDQIYDPNNPTALLTVYEDSLTVELPTVYFSNNTVEGEIRIDIYTTKGPLDLILGNYTINNFIARWLDIEGEDNGKYTAPLNAFSAIAVYSDKVVSGGSKALTFEELRNIVMSNALGVPDLPITNAQMSVALERMGYNLVKNIDNITNRQFLATRDLPPPTDGSVSSGIGVSIRTVELDIEDIRNKSFVKDNGVRITLLPKTLYEDVGGKVEFVDPLVINQINAMNTDAKIAMINSSRFAYTPFHYVLDTERNNFSLRGYYLDSPKILTKSFIEENDSAQLEVSVGRSYIEKYENGYKLTVILNCGETFKTLKPADTFIQLSFKPIGEVERAFINGTLVGTVNESPMYEFVIDTNYDIDVYNNISITNFKMFDDSERILSSSLDSEFDIVIVAANHQPPDLKQSTIDTILGRILLPNVVVGVVRERVKIRFGTELQGLWANARTVISSQQYLTYDADVPAVYSENVYKRDALGVLEFTVNPTTQKVEFTVLHAKGDPILTAEGAQLIEHYAGDTVIGSDGLPIIKGGRGLLRQIDLMLFDGIYYFATEVTSTSYRDSQPILITDWLENDIKKISSKLLEQTRLFFYPKTTLGSIAVLVDEGLKTTIYSNQSFKIKYLVTNSVYSNSSLRGVMTKVATDTINEVLQNDTVSITDIQSKLRAKIGSDALSIDISGFGNNGKLTAFSVLDNSVRGTIKKRLVVLPDNSFAVQDDVIVDFIKHDV